MVHISQKLADSIQNKKTIFSFEFYPPKTGQVCCSPPIAVCVNSTN